MTTADRATLDDDQWTEGNPVTNLLRFLFLGVGEIAPTTREVLRRAEPNRAIRPKVHVG